MAWISVILSFFVFSPGTGKSKKLAKRQAAYKMTQRLKDQPVEQPPVNVLADDDDEVKLDVVDGVTPDALTSLHKLNGVAPDGLVSLHDDKLRDSGGKESCSPLDAASTTTLPTSFVGRKLRTTGRQTYSLHQDKCDTEKGKESFVKEEVNGNAAGSYLEGENDVGDDSICSKCGMYKDDGYGSFSGFGTSLYCSCITASEVKEEIKKEMTEE